MSLAAILWSWALIALLCHGDPKRRRAARLPGEGQSPAQRRALFAAACLPGLGWALAGRADAFLIWLGGAAVAGWATAGWFNRRSGTA